MPQQPPSSVPHRTSDRAHEPYEGRLTGGHPNSLGNTIAVVDDVLVHPERLEELYGCFFSADPVVRLRTANAWKRIAKAHHELPLPYQDRLLAEVAEIEQASVQWTFAQIMLIYTNDLNAEQRRRATQVMQRNLEQSSDWIVLAQTANTLARWAKTDEDLKRWLIPRLQELESDPRKAVGGKATKMLALLEAKQ